jgi:ribosomal protein S18 acetylase RimI-like enzyme
LSNKEVVIRDFRKSDLDELLDLIPRCFAKEFEISGFDPDHMRSLMNRAYGVVGRLFLGVSRLLRKEPIKFFVAEVGGKVVGTTMVDIRPKIGYISAVMVSPDQRRRGIATTMVKGAVEYIQRRGLKRAVLHAVTTNAPAIGVYSKLGFEPFEEVAHLAGEVPPAPARRAEGAVATRPFRSGDLDAVYDLYRASEDPAHTRVFEMSKSQLKAPFWMRLFRFSTQERMVALRDGKVVGSVLASYTTPKEAGNMAALHVRPEDRSRGVEAALAGAAMEAIRAGGVGKVVAMVPKTRPEVAETLAGLGLREAMVLVGMSRETSE